MSLALQTLYGPPPTWGAILVRVYSEVSVGVLLGAASAVLVALVALIWLGELKVGLCILGGIAGGMTCAAAFGVAMPNVLRRLELDPKVAAGPIALAVADMVTLLIYRNLRGG